MKIWKDQKGFSLVELIIVVGIVAILASVSLRIVGQLRSANMEKALKTLSDGLTKQQMRTMSKENKPYMHIYEFDGKYYYCLSEQKTFSYSSMKASSMEIGTGITIKYKDSGSELTIQGLTNVLTISYKKDGSFLQCPDELILVSSNSTRTIIFNKETGRRVIE